MLQRAFGQFLRDHLRKEDIACRYGGEEFCVLLWRIIGRGYRATRRTAPVGT